MIEAFKKDVLEGLSKEKKTLPSKYFYDKKGDKLFQRIMSMPEYYLTRAEMEIFTEKSAEIVELLQMNQEIPFEIIELGAGDGVKTMKLLERLLDQGYNFEYLPIDISQNALDGLSQTLQVKLPELKVKPMQGTYFHILKKLHEVTKPRVILFLGSNLGNLIDEDATRFIYDLGACLNTSDKILLGLDRIKERNVVLPAYNDSQGITAEFNLNLLDRINRELGADFHREQFEHAPKYTEEEGMARSYIVSKMDQRVTIKSLNKTFHFSKDEKIHTEISRKYSKEILERILKKTDFSIDKILSDKKEYFMSIVLSKK